MIASGSIETFMEGVGSPEPAFFRFQTTRKAKGANLTVRTAISADGAAKVLNMARAMLRSWRLGTLAPSIAIVAVVMLPICVIAAIALNGTADDWPHLATYVLPQAFGVTLTLVALVAAGTAFVGVSCAWIVVTYDFPFRRLLTWALILPLAVPPYLAAYAFGE